MSRSIYLDFNASTPIAPEVAAAMRPFLEGHFGNPSSPHWAGAPARSAIERAREEVADLIGASPPEIVFVSGGTEATNTALKGVYWSKGGGDAHIITTAVEHPATLEACAFLRRQGATITIVSVDRYGRVDPEEIRRSITLRTILISVMHANNEVGTIQPIREIAQIARSQSILLHADASQSLGKIATNVGDLGVDLLTIAGHKLYAPKGIGALFIRRGVSIEPLLHGGAHESGRRAGTESALLAVGLGAACRLAMLSLERADEIRARRDRLWRGLHARLGDRVVLNGHPEHRLPNTLNVSFVGRSASKLLSSLEGIALSTGSACHAGSIEVSPVLKAMGAPHHVGMGAVRFSLGRSTTDEEIDAVIEAVIDATRAD